MQLIDLIAQNEDLQTLAQALPEGGRHVISGLTGTARTTYLGALHKQVAGPTLLIADNAYHADQIFEDLVGLLGESSVYIFPTEDTLATETALTSPDVLIARVGALHALRHQADAIIVTSTSGVQRYLPPVDMFDAAALTIDFDHEFELSELQSQFMEMGYQKTAAVEQAGEFAVRGSIVDVFPMDAAYPVRMDFFDTELDSLRSFDIATQRSQDNLENVTILPATDLIADAGRRQAFTTDLELMLTEQRDALEGAAKRHLTEGVQPLLDMLADNQMPGAVRAYLDVLYPEQISILDYLPTDGVAIFDDYPRALENAAQFEVENKEWLSEQAESGLVLQPKSFGLKLAELARDVKQASVITTTLQRGIGNLRQTSLTNVTVRPAQQFFGQMPLLKNDVSRWQKQGYTILFLANTPERVEKTEGTLNDFGVATNAVAADALVTERTQVTELALSAGFEWPAQKMMVVTERELFQQVKKKAPRRQTLSNAERIKSYNELNVGDYVVHTNHGIGIYEGMETIERNGVKQDYITIGFQKDAKIFIPVTQLDLVQKYVGAAEKAPKINKLGGTEWQKTKAKVAKKVEDIADDLLALYAERELRKGFAFSPDGDAQQRFEAAFPYAETPDQSRSTEEIKRDMEKKRPMDRLLIGDVGFGKTEVAMRASFKAVNDHKQVAVLGPTTILAQQHYESFVSRFAGTDAKIGVLSRFQSTKHRRETLEALALGEIDVVIGTHRLLSKDVQFSDLGLLIVDEEQRFGVKHKERLKELQANVDVLTLTATPIPRTLNMSMVGVRDLSVIETPPANRYPIQTYVIEQNGQTIASGIERELSRGGQVFYLHNRVDDIEKTVDYIQTLAPEARVTYVHGQMTETQLEGVLVDFINGEYDVLVTTTIIETGVDIPNANTLFVENADHMGLSQLYQLRGRVGRSNNLAYAYFMYPGTRSLSEESEKRLEAIRDFTELGSGFKIAMRDLSIRGAGDLLGQSQHGFINTVGYDLYMQMLNEAVEAKRGKKQVEKTDAELDLQVQAYLPQDYISDGPQKIEIYQRIRKSNKPEEFAEIVDDLFDRFGELPETVEALIEVGQLKANADYAMITQMKRPRQNLNQVVMSFDEKFVDMAMVQNALKKAHMPGQVKQINQLELVVPIQAAQSELEWLKMLNSFAAELRTIRTKEK
ncbi:transcription-repair coupling factor [Weissella ceti]|uniref:Transcription-repair-coupling factor n=1 Tax=Weissella ceti TaxID=759620 RepID=A0ABT3E6I1_9LACO|nr:transcription-repair coupling factor [Weissella ceti]MCW0953548.1 transcription-repair coupling factor [Weissella ceti]QVK12310.1 transcription-repair coupling factor [Weissella ceti]